MSAVSRVDNPELDEALARAIRQLIAEAIEAGANSEMEAAPDGTASAA
jgi:hypothetical protein